MPGGGVVVLPGPTLIMVTMVNEAGELERLSTRCQLIGLADGRAFIHKCTNAVCGERRKQKTGKTLESARKMEKAS